MAKPMTKNQARAKFKKLYKAIIVAHGYAGTTPLYGDDPWQTLKDIEGLLRGKKKLMQELRNFFLESDMAYARVPSWRKKK